MSVGLEATRTILEQRARLLAQPRDADTTGPVQQLLTFSLGHECYGLDAAQVEGVFRLHHLTPLPSAPPRLAGATSWRGELLTVLDLEWILGIERSGLDDRVWVVAVEIGTVRFGLLAGIIGEVVDVEIASIRPLQETKSGLVSGRTGDALLVLSGRGLASILESGDEP